MRRLLVLLAVPFLAHCGDGAVPIPDHFKAAFATGNVCVPKQVGNGSAASTYPVRFDFCRYRCISIDRATAQLHSAWQCAGGYCQMVMLATADANRVTTEKGCDARDLESPPPGECTPDSFGFNPTVPVSAATGAPESGDFHVAIPYLTIEQSNKVMARIDAGESPLVVLETEVGNQNYPNRQFTVQFDPGNAAATSIFDSDCTPIGLP
jgi:hypothetical protein